MIMNKRLFVLIALLFLYLVIFSQDTIRYEVRKEYEQGELLLIISNDSLILQLNANKSWFHQIQKIEINGDMLYYFLDDPNIVLDFNWHYNLIFYHNKKTGVIIEGKRK